LDKIGKKNFHILNLIELQSDNVCVFIIFFKSSFLSPWDPFFSKTLGQPREVKNGPIILKFSTIVDRMNTWRH